jgi:hypothetical protein
VFVEHKKLAYLDLIAASAPSIVPKGMLNTSNSLKDRFYQGETDAATSIL